MKVIAENEFMVFLYVKSQFFIGSEDERWYTGGEHYCSCFCLGGGEIHYRKIFITQLSWQSVSFLSVLSCLCYRLPCKAQTGGTNVQKTPTTSSKERKAFKKTLHENWWRHSKCSMKPSTYLNICVLQSLFHTERKAGLTWVSVPALYVHLLRCATKLRQWLAFQSAIKPDKEKSVERKLVKVLYNNNRVGWKVERLIIHEATHWMAPT